jgi:serine/threonine protein kinase
MAAEALNRDALAVVLEAKGYTLVNEIGCGTSGRVCLVFSRRYQSHFVVKVMSLHVHQFCTDCEVLALKELTSPYVITLYDYDRTPDAVYMFLEYCPHGSLDGIVAKSGPLTGSKFYGVCKAFLTGLAYIHSQRCAHSDLKPANILIDRYGRPKLADFGFARIFNGRSLTDSRVGSMTFCAPEVFRAHSFDPFKADIWSAALTIIWLGTGSSPWVYKKPPALINEICGGLVRLPHGFDPTLGSLIHAMTKLEPTKRPTADECLAFEPIASADMKGGILSQDKKSVLSPMHGDPRRAHITPLTMGSRTASMIAKKKPIVLSETFDSSCVTTPGFALPYD